MSMESINGIVVPGDITRKDKRRFRVIPLTTEKVDRAGIGEVVVDRKTGDVYIVDNNGTVISRTSNIEELIHKEMVNNVNQLSFMYNHNLRVYRLFFTSEFVRIDRNLVLDNSATYFRVRALDDNAKYYVSTLTPINSKAVLLEPLVDNEVYFVEFYNMKKEMISMLPFSAKAALYFENEIDNAELIQRIIIYTNKDIAYVGEDPTSLLVKVYAVYEDGSEKDITDYSTVDIDMSEIDFDKAGVYNINATYVYDIDNVLSLTASVPFEVSEDKTVTISDVIVVPRKIINLNDGSREIRLSVIVYYADGSCEDVSERTIVSVFDPTLFNESQTIVIKLNAGTVNVFTNTYEIQVNDDGSASKYVMNFTEENILELDDMTRVDNPYPVDALFFRVRDAEDLNIFYTPTYNELHYNAIFADSNEHKIAEGKNVIVEFYDMNRNLIDSDAYTCKYKSEV